ncbi:MAG: glycosyltransferase family 2 protein [Desulfovibrionaceae bacterium]|nr:glycosyltransferase family 2 protein [Desulfovibrionaceae bacterium]
MLFNAIFYVWNEEDIIRSTVLHAFRQGCDNVFVIDNGSSDATVARARKAGARLAALAPSETFNTREKTCHMNAFVRYYNSLHFDDEVWWMYCDADEFMHAHTNCTLRELIMSARTSEITALKGFFYDHVPSHPPYHVEGFHPIDYMPLCSVSTVSKIPIVKYTFGKKHIFSAGGAHEIATDGETLVIAEDAIAIHHFQYRTPGATLRRLKKLLARLSWMNKRSEYLYKSKSAYNIRYATVREQYRAHRYEIFKPRSLPYSFADCQRWYDARSDAQFANLSPMERALAMAVYYDFLGEPTIALCRYNDLLDYSAFAAHTEWILLKIANCFAHTDPDAAQSLYDSLAKSANPEIRASLTKPRDTHAKPKKNVLRAVPYTAGFAVDPKPLMKRVRDIERYAFMKAELTMPRS